MIEKTISLVMYGIKKCSGACLYCSAASTMDYRDKENGNTKSFVFDKEKTKNRILEYTQVLKDLENGEAVHLSIDIWGGNPVENFEEFKQTVEFCQNELKEFNRVSLHTSGNGLELQSEDIVQYLIDNNIHYQLSHDGLGQWLRTGDIDPLFWDKTKNNIVKLAKLGILDWINCTLNSYNYSFFSNIEFWNKWRKENDLMDIKTLTIKLNHIYPGTPPITKKWFGKDIPGDINGTKPCKNGQKIGDLNFDKDQLLTYFHEIRKLGTLCMSPGIEKTNEFGPYVGYILGQVNRWQTIKSDTEAGLCRAFQMGLIDKTFAIDTAGEYCQCNLIDSSTKVKNPTGWRPDECKDCVYTNQAECHMCGSETMSVCNHGYNYQWCQVLEEFAQLYQLLDAVRNENQQNGCNGDCNGNCGDHHECNCNQPDRNQDAVYCVKNYKV